MVDWNPKSNGDDYTGPIAKGKKIDKLTGNSYESEKQMYMKNYNFTEAEAEFVLETETQTERDDIASRIISRNAYKLLEEEVIRQSYPQFDPKVISSPFAHPETYEGQISILFQVMNFFLWNNCPSYKANYNGIEANVHHIQLHCAGEIEIWARPNSEPQEILAVFFNPEPE